MSHEGFLRSQLEDLSLKEKATREFLCEHRDDPVAVGALRLLTGHLPTVCPDCGEDMDPILGPWCSCWSPITPENKPEWLDDGPPPGPDK